MGTTNSKKWKGSSSRNFYRRAFKSLFFFFKLNVISFLVDNVSYRNVDFIRRTGLTACTQKKLRHEVYDTTFFAIDDTVVYKVRSVRIKNTHGYS